MDPNDVDKYLQAYSDSLSDDELDRLAPPHLKERIARAGFVDRRPRRIRAAVALLTAVAACIALWFGLMSARRDPIGGAPTVDAGQHSRALRLNVGPTRGSLSTRSATSTPILGEYWVGVRVDTPGWLYLVERTVAGELLVLQLSGNKGIKIWDRIVQGPFKVDEPNATIEPSAVTHIIAIVTDDPIADPEILAKALPDRTIRGADDDAVAAALDSIAIDLRRRFGWTVSFGALPLVTERHGAQLTVNQILASLHPPRLDELVPLLDPVPTVDEALAPLPEDAPVFRTLTGDGAQQVSALENDLMALRGEGRFAEATLIAETIADIRLQKQSADHWETRAALNALDAVRFAARAPTEAQAELADADANERRIVFELFNGQGYIEGLGLIVENWIIRDRWLPLEHADRLSNLINLAEYLRAVDRPRDAAFVYRETLPLAMRIQGRISRETGQVIENLSGTLASTGDFDSMGPFARLGTYVSRRTYGDGFIGVAWSLGRLANSLPAETNFETAIAIRKRSIEIAEANKSDEWVALMTTSYGRTLQILGMPIEAEAAYRASLAKQRAAFPYFHPYVAENLEGLATLAIERGDHFSGARLLGETLSNLEQSRTPRDATEGRTRGLLAIELSELGMRRDADRMFDEALTILQQQSGVHHPDTAQLRVAWAGQLAKERRFDEAEKLLREAIAAVDGSPRRASQLIACLASLHLGRLYSSLGNLESAEAELNTALGRLQGLPGSCSPNMSDVYSELARVALKGGRLCAAADLFAKAAEHFEGSRTKIGMMGVERAYFATGRSPLLELAACQAQLGDRVTAWATLEAHNARGLLDDVFRRRARHIGEQDLKKWELIEKEVADLEQSMVGTTLPTKRSEAANADLTGVIRRADLVAQRSALSADMCRTYGPLAGEFYDLARIQAALPSNAVIITWVDVPTQAEGLCGHWAVIVGPHGDPVWVPLRGRGADGLFTENDLLLPRRVRESLCDSAQTGDRSRELLRELHQRRIEPIAPLLANATKLVVIPSESMAGIPLEVMEHQFVVSYVPSGTFYAWLREAGRPAMPDAATPLSPRLLAVGDPILPAQPANGSTSPSTDRAASASSPGARGHLNAKAVQALLDRAAASGTQSLEETLATTRGPSYQPIPGTRAEIRSIVELFQRRDGKYHSEADGEIHGEDPGPTVLLGDQATLANLLAMDRSGQLGAFRVLHFATHADVNSVVPLLSSLVLSPAESGNPLSGGSAADSHLTVERILRTWDLHADLVVLSACDTGLGKPLGGEGYLGFSQALFAAGARTLVLSLWKVDDRATTLLMHRFYENLLGQFDEARAGGEPGRPMACAVALHEAKEWMRNQTPSANRAALARLGAFVEGDIAYRASIGQSPGDSGVAEFDFSSPHYWAAFVLVGFPG